MRHGVGNSSAGAMASVTHGSAATARRARREPDLTAMDLSMVALPGVDLAASGLQAAGRAGALTAGGERCEFS